jgi:hypothetical protein
MRLRFILERDILSPLSAMSVPESPKVGPVGNPPPCVVHRGERSGWRLGSGLHGPSCDDQRSFKLRRERTSRTIDSDPFGEVEST